MKKFVLKPLSLCLCAALLISTVGGAVYALTSDRDSVRSEADSAEVAEVIENKNEDGDLENTKNETVYILAGADGAVQKIIVSDWIQNTLGSASLNDQTVLSDIQNVKGDEHYTLNGNNMCVWDAQGKDIYYQGNIEKELPVALSVSYMLDGVRISPDQLSGKSGHVIIRFDYQNRQYENVEIDGKQEKIYVPFVILTGMLLSNDVFRNVTVTNGKLINDGDRTAVIGIAFPGLQSNLAIDKEKLDIPDYIEISADVEQFEMTATITVAANSVFNEIDLDQMSDLDDLTESVGELSDAMDQLIDGSSKLYDGIATLLDKSGELINGINQLADGAAALKDGSGTLNSGASELKDGASKLAAGLNTLAANNDTLNSGACQVFDSLLAMADEQLSAAGLIVPKLTIENYTETLNGVLASLEEKTVSKLAEDTALEKVTEAVWAQEATVRSAVSAAVEQQISAQVQATIQSVVESKVLAAVGLTKERYDEGVKAGIITEEEQARITAAIDQQMSSDDVKKQIQLNIETQMQSSDVKALIDAKTEEQIEGLIEQNMSSDAVKTQISAAIESAKAGAASISALQKQLDSYKQFYSGLLAYTDGVANAQEGANGLSDGAAALKDGTANLYTGAAALYDGILSLQKGSVALTDGVSELKEGAMQLSDGLKEFNEEGIQKLVDAVEGDLGGLMIRLRATLDVSKHYQSFAGISDDMDGQVKFIYRTDSIKSE